jgi:regulatory protein
VSDKPDTPAALKARALRYLVRREHSRAELERKLAAHAPSPEALDALLQELHAKRQLSDERFAAERARTLSRKYGPARIRHDLRSKGIASEVIAGVAALPGELERARAILERKYREPAATREERAKRARFLQGRGFSMDVISRLVRGDDEAA